MVNDNGNDSLQQVFKDMATVPILGEGQPNIVERVNEEKADSFERITIESAVIGMENDIATIAKFKESSFKKLIDIIEKLKFGELNGESFANSVKLSGEISPCRRTDIDDLKRETSKSGFTKKRSKVVNLIREDFYINLFVRLFSYDSSDSAPEWLNHDDTHKTLINIAKRIFDSEVLSDKLKEWNEYRSIHNMRNKLTKKFRKREYDYAWLFREYDNERGLWEDNRAAAEMRRQVRSVLQTSPKGNGAIRQFIDNISKSTSGTFGTWVTDMGRKCLIETSSAGSDTLMSDMEQWRNLQFEYPLEERKKCLAAIYKYASQNASKEDMPSFCINPQFMFVFGNWGDSIRLISPSGSLRINPQDEWDYSYEHNIYNEDGEINQDYCQYIGKLGIPLYNDFLGEIFSQGDHDTEVRGMRNGSLLSSQHRNSLIKGRDNIGRFIRAIYGTPLWGAYMTDCYKGVSTADDNILQKILGKNKNDLDNVMYEIIKREYNRLVEVNDNKKVLVMTVNNFWDYYSNTIMGKSNIQSWQIIRWPHHSGQNSGAFKAITLAYAYGKIDRALRHIWEQDELLDDALPTEWCDHFSSWFFANGDPVAFPGADRGESLLKWFEEGFDFNKRNFFKPNELSDEYRVSTIYKSFELGWIAEDKIIKSDDCSDGGEFFGDRNKETVKYSSLEALMPDFVEHSKGCKVDIKDIEKELDFRLNIIRE